MIKNKIEIKDKILELRSNNKKIVFTNGCFDILHPGHTTYLKESRNLGDFLIVAINSDESVRHLKGPGRPINSQSLRSKNLLNLEFVDAVTIFEEKTPKKLIKYLLPDILTKGGDYKTKNIIGSRTIQQNGGKIVILPHLKGYSTTSIISNNEKGLTEERGNG